MEGAIKSFVDACKGSVDLLAFAAIIGLGLYGLLNGLDFLMFVGFVAIAIPGWIGLRYAMFGLQSKERLRALKEESLRGGGTLIDQHATPAEKKALARPVLEDGTNADD